MTSLDLVLWRLLWTVLSTFWMSYVMWPNVNLRSLGFVGVATDDLIFCIFFSFDTSIRNVCSKNTFMASMFSRPSIALITTDTNSDRVTCPAFVNMDLSRLLFCASIGSAHVYNAFPHIRLRESLRLPNKNHFLWGFWQPHNELSTKARTQCQRPHAQGFCWVNMFMFDLSSSTSVFFRRFENHI